MIYCTLVQVPLSTSILLMESCLTSINNDGGWWFGAVGKDNKLYYTSGNRRSIGVIDSDTLH